MQIRALLANPAIVFALAGVLAIGGVCLRKLRVGSPFRINREGESIRGPALAALAATAFAVGAVVADVVLRYPASINVPLPAALWFYPLIAVVAECAFHVIPLTAVLMLLGKHGGTLSARQLWLSMLAVAMLEPAFQAAIAEHAFAATGVFTTIHVYAINVTQLYLFRRCGFFAMLTLRLVY